MCSTKLLGLFLLPLAACADTGYTATRLLNTAAPLTITLVSTGDTADLRMWQPIYRADTAFYTPASRQITFVCHLATGDSLEVGQGDEGPFWQRNPPPLFCDSLRVRPATGPSVWLMKASIQQFVTGTSQDRYRCCGEYLRITTVYKVVFPQTP
ncbi:hypothetical protein [Hymenobacter crusticola]|uniref:Uncharacterized protein n=1 Tax=Hymenobacter crusticola TaxID=1770526 RepID=A0A2C9ZTS1_9BACT|nr:hypothetical protein [Hymenobacter crusticola]OUJ68302.1 hypothetical protein BXP70_28060 [Hymenobacter crusticola]